MLTLHHNLHTNFREDKVTILTVKIVTKQHTPPQRDDIILVVGDIVEVGEEDTSNPNWKNWIWCISKKNNTSGWVPKQILLINDSNAQVMQNYSSKELKVSVGEELILLHQLNGWSWCKNKFGEHGWVPDENFI